ncbi:unnamed protein product [Rangifer tarandus platyrhynchus]|uniref:Uncharacterized protein n=2 Tax=Rangifer tarandus platyrhynchus TaxID=3082113 RepID=A0ABN8YQG2_RANTA|nr:unnamed protein product [Rangifer tarandus platyrhynchus]
MSAYLALPRSLRPPQTLCLHLLSFPTHPATRSPHPPLSLFGHCPPAPHLVLMASLWLSASDLSAHLSAFPPHYPSEPAQLLDLSSEDTLLHTPLVQCPVALDQSIQFRPS